MEKLRHILTTRDFSREWLDKLFVIARGMPELRGKPGGIMLGKVMTTLFYEPSTRTRLSFEAAMLGLGGQVMGTENAREFSSAIKGETIEDTARVMGGLCDVIVMRHNETGAAARAAIVSSVPIVNAGDGVGEHPTQSLIDLYTILEERGTLEGLTVTMFGDLKYGRTVHSLARLLALYGARLRFVSPRQLAFPGVLLKELHDLKVDVLETPELKDVIRETDVLYVTRVQKERFADPKEFDALRGSYRVDLDTLIGAKANLVIMHPLPRVDEIATTVDALPNAAYFRQAHNGLPVRMALLRALFVGL